MAMDGSDKSIQHGVRSPIMSLNDNLDFFGKDVHVQTENVDSTDPYIVTQVFLHGRVVQTTKYEYPDEVRNRNEVVKIHDLMRMQHMEVIEKINRQQEKYRGLCEQKAQAPDRS
jgi:hypothetical protein